MDTSRTSNSLKNMAFGVGSQMLSILLGFFTRWMFIALLGKEYLGVSGLFTNVLSLLSLANLGFDTAIIYSLYKPLAEGDMDVKPQGLGFVHKSLPHGRSRVSDGFILPFSANECKPGPSSIPNGRSPLCINLPPLRHPKEKHVRRTLPWT